MKFLALSALAYLGFACVDLGNGCTDGGGIVVDVIKRPIGLDGGKDHRGKSHGHSKDGHRGHSKDGKSVGSGRGRSGSRGGSRDGKRGRSGSRRGGSRDGKRGGSRDRRGGKWRGGEGKDGRGNSWGRGRGNGSRDNHRDGRSRGNWGSQSIGHDQSGCVCKC